MRCRLVSVSHSVRQIESAEMIVSQHGVNKMESPAVLEARRRVIELQAELLAAQQRAMGIELFKGIGVGSVAMTEVERLKRLHLEQNFGARINYASGKYREAHSWLNIKVDPDEQPGGLTIHQQIAKDLRSMSMLGV